MTKMPTKITNGDVSTLQIPVVDFSVWTKDIEPNARVKVAKQIVDACREVGFVYIVNHELPDALLDEAFAWSRRFFALSQEDKLKAPHPDGWAVHRGYSWPGLEKVSQAMSEGDDEERVKKLREITDCKVRKHGVLARPAANVDGRKATTWAATLTNSNRTSGFPTIPFQASESS
jgi:isopenicillin N synthase-like dioxygenase